MEPGSSSIEGFSETTASYVVDPENGLDQNISPDPKSTIETVTIDEMINCRVTPEAAMPESPTLSNPRARGVPGSTRMKALYIADLPLYETVQPYVLKRKPPPGIPRSNVTLIPKEDIIVADVRDEKARFSLNQQGFQFEQLPLREALDNPDSIARHLEEVRSFLRTLLGVEDVRVFEYKFRCSQPGIDPSYRKPSDAVHVDQTAYSAKRRIKFHYPEEYKSLVKRHYRLINVWHPLNATPVQDCPLALCDSQTVADSDLVACDLVYEHYEGEHFKVKYSPSHKWYFLHHQTRDEVILIQNYDSKSNIRCPHTAFKDPQAPPNSSPRRSIEIRTIVFD